MFFFSYANIIFLSAENAMQLLITVCSIARHEVTIERCSPGIEITSQFLPVPMSMQMSSMLDTTITCHIVRWLRNCCVTPAPRRNQPKDPRMAKWWTANWELKTRLKICGKHQLRLWARLSARALAMGTPLMAVGNVTRTWRFVQTGRCQLTADGTTWPKEQQLAWLWLWLWLWPRPEETEELIQFGAELTWLPATLVVVKAAKGNRNP